MIKDITTPTKNLNTDDLLKERVDITIDTTKKKSKTLVKSKMLFQKKELK